MLEDDEYSQYQRYHQLKREYFMRRRRILVLMMSVVTACGLYFLLRYLPPFSSFEPTVTFIVSLSFVIFPIFFFNYLGSSSSGRSSDYFLHRVERLEHIMREREQDVTRALESIHLDDKDKERLVAEAKTTIIESAKAGALDEIRASITRDESERQFQDALRSIPRRLEQEIDALRRRSNVGS